MQGKAILQGEKLHVSSESYPNDGSVTRHPVEKGEGKSITDHVSVSPKSVSLRGILVRPTNEEVETLISKLESWQEVGTLLQYEGRRIMANIVIESFDVDTDSKNANGFAFSMKLVKIQLAESSYQKSSKPVTNEGRKQTKNPNTRKKYHVVRKGDTYWGCARKYGTSVKQLEKWNPWPARVIPIGVKMRVG
ncbi:muramidase family protein [Halobacillus litoralis]|uniref:LysM domain-containing protein n=1 Tax=Halobacillus litoralis TaxID=45668 RepID=A0A410MDI1_9BACI|nr:LysM peptidoglycan-binding domain-containing protein [Halobacillus litoralis]QAS52804.1 LysM domain-containing protein [Halobacillus litoralis]